MTTDALSLIIADDFTGACDTGLQFVRGGFSAGVISGLREGLMLPQYDVLVYNTDSRNCDSERARQLVTEACQRLKGLQPSLIYKKVDSTIRGNLATEIDAIMQAFALDVGVVAPAFPETGRTTLRGQHLLNGVPIEQTEMADDPGSPISDSHLPRLLSSTLPIGGSSRQPLVVRHLNIDAVACGEAHLRSCLKAPQDERVLFVCDAVSPEDLRRIAVAAASLTPLPLLCGSAGLAQFVPEAFALITNSEPTPSLKATPGPVLVVVGSAHSHSRRQTERLLTRDNAREFRGGAETLEPALRHLTSTADAVAVLSIADAPRSEAALRNLTALVCTLVEGVPELAGVAVTGGTTAMELIVALRANGVEIVEAMGREVPVCRLTDGPFRGLPLVTKAGAFGDEDIFIKAV